jgi:hypothetical protein
LKIQGESAISRGTIAFVFGFDKMKRIRSVDAAAEEADPETKVRRRKEPARVIRTTRSRSITQSHPTPTTRLTNVREKFLKVVEHDHLRFKHNVIGADQARLLIVDPGKLDDKISVSLLTVEFKDLGKKYQYEALSYHWCVTMKFPM